MTAEAVTAKLNEVKEALAEFGDTAAKLVRENPGPPSAPPRPPAYLGLRP